MGPALWAGVPVVAPEWAWGGWEPDPVCVAYNSTIPELARRTIELVGDASLRRRAGERGREQFAVHAGGDGDEGFVRGVQEAWEALEVPAGGAADE
jgi:hypothetical protein